MILLNAIVAIVLVGWTSSLYGAGAGSHKFSGRTTYHGIKVNWAVWYAFRCAEILLSDPHFGGERDWITTWQGCWSTRVRRSAGTHAGTGTADISPYNWKNRVFVFRLLGFAAWMRPAIRGVWVQHIHMVMCGDGGAARLALQQVVAFWKRPSRDGLAGNRVDTQKPQMLCRPLYVFPEKESGRPGKFRCEVACHAYHQQTTQAPQYGEVAVGDIVDFVFITRDRDTGKYWGVTKQGRCMYKDNFVRAAA